MRIRKGRPTRGDARASATASPPQMDDISQQLELVSSSRGFKQKFHKSEDMEQRHSLNVAERSFDKAPLGLLERLQISSTSVLIPPERPYMNLDEFVTSLARKNCFPADDHSDDSQSDEDHSDDPHNNITGQSSCSLINSSKQTGDDEESPNFGRLFGAVSAGSAEALRGDIAAVETSLRLATSSSVSAHLHYKPANLRTTTLEMEAAAAAAAAEEADQTMKSSTEKMEQGSGRHTRVSSSTGRKRARLPSPAALFHDEQTEAQEEASSDSSVQQAESSRRAAARKRTRTQVSVSPSTLTTPAHPSEKKKQRVGKAVAKRSGRPKKLKYLQQDNVEELGNQCNRRDGKGWTCPLLAKPGYQLCDHHLDKLRCKPGSRSKHNKTMKTKKKSSSNIS